jgi:hypothetical protein
VFHRQHHAGEVDRYKAVPLFLVDLTDRSGSEKRPGIVHRDVEGAIGRDGFGEEAGNIVGAAHIGSNGGSNTALATNERQRFRQPILGTSGDDHLRPLSGKGLRNRAADARAAARDQGGPVRKAVAHERSSRR